MSICIFGASSTWGAWDSELGGWANRLRLYIDEVNDDFVTYNLAIDGETTRGLLKRFDTETETRKPSIIIFSLGDNDAAFNESINENLVPLPEFEENIATLIEKAKKHTDKIFFLSFKKLDDTKTTPIPLRTELHYKTETLLEYSNRVKEITEKENVSFIDLVGILGNEDLEDGLHPNEEGHRKIFEKVKDSIKMEIE